MLAELTPVRAHMLLPSPGGPRAGLQRMPSRVLQREPGFGQRVSWRKDGSPDDPPRRGQSWEICVHIPLLDPQSRGPQKREQEVGYSQIPLAWAMPLGLGALSEQRWGCLKAVSRSPSRFWFWKLECSQRCRGRGVVPCSHHQESSHPAAEGILAVAKGSEEGGG